MANVSLADQLDDAIEMMIAEPDSAPPRVDLKIGELLRIAAELRLLPDPAFRAALKAELAGQGRVVVFPEHSDARPAVGAERRDTADEKILPSLFSAGAGSYPVRRGNFAISLAVHAALLALIATSGLWVGDRGARSLLISDVFVSDTRSTYAVPVTKIGSESGGGAHEKSAASKGQMPRLAREQLTPPTVIVPREPPKLAVDMTLIGPPDLKLPAQVGDPLAKILGPLSNGGGSGGGIGAGDGGGIGNGHGAYRVGGGISAPRAIYDPDPEYSEEARLAKYQGSVLLWVVVGTDGRPHEMRVQRSLGMGLDEKAMEAVRGWRFSPGMKDGVPVAVQMNVEVTFRLF